jgi:post-segregation antitoxin (ccd killing protein)
VNYKWPASIREPAYAVDAAKQTVSLTINSDLFTRVKALGINASRIAEEALAQELERQRRAVVLAEVEADVRAADAYTAQHGDHAELVRKYYEGQKAGKNRDDD